MTLHDYTKCPKCRASIAKTARACPICGQDQGKSGTARPAAPTRPATPSYSSTPPKSYSTPPVYASPSSSTRKNADVIMILGGVLVLAVFVVILIAATHHSAPVASVAATTPVTTPTAEATPTDAELNAQLKNIGQQLHAADSRTPLNTTNITQALGIVTYCGVVSTDAQLVADSEGALEKDAKKFEDNQQVITDSVWKEQVRQDLLRVHQVTTAMANVMIVPAECTELNQSVRTFASVSDSGCHDMMNGIIEQNEQEFEKGKSELEQTRSLADTLSSNMENLKARYTH